MPIFPSVLKEYSSSLDPYVKHYTGRRYKGGREVMGKEEEEREGGQKKANKDKMKCYIYFNKSSMAKILHCP